MRIVIVGAGIIGAAVAARLGGGAAHISLVDAGPPGAGTSKSSMAWINAHNKKPRSYFDFARAGMRAHAAFAERAGGSWYRPARTLQWAEDDAGGRDLQETVDRLAEWGCPTEWISASAAAGEQPSLRLPAHVESVACFPDEALVDPQPLVGALIDRAEASGVRVLTGPHAQVIELTTTGTRISGVALAGGDHLPADVVICCAGWRTPQVAATAGTRVVLVPGDAPGSEAPTLLAHVQQGPHDGPLDRLILAPGLHARPLPGRRLYLEALDLNDLVDAHTPRHRIDELSRELLHRAREILPGAAGGAVLTEGRVCIRPLPPDDHPVVGWQDEVGGLYTAVTHSGITLSLHLAGLIAEEVLHGRQAEALAGYRPGRFA